MAYRKNGLVLVLGFVLAGCSAEPNNTGAGNWRAFTMTDAGIISQAGIDMAGYFPDGKISVIKDEETDKYIAFWGERYSFRTEADTPYPEDHISQITPVNRVLGVGINEQDGFNDGGSWFIGVHRLVDGRLAGFFHAESHWKGGGMAYKSIGVAHSSDNGRTWTRGDKILNVHYPKPAAPEWSGLGDGCVVYNRERGQFICYYSGGDDYNICMAVSSDPAGAAGTWKKWDGRAFTADGYNSASGTGGRDGRIEGLSSRSGSNPSVMWNDYLQKWVMVYWGWDEVIYMSSSDNGLVWKTPVALTDVNKEKVRYPNLIGDNGDTNGGETVRLYYARNQDSWGVREFAWRTLTYK